MAWNVTTPPSPSSWWVSILLHTPLTIPLYNDHIEFFQTIFDPVLQLIDRLCSLIIWVQQPFQNWPEVLDWPQFWQAGGVVFSKKTTFFALKTKRTSIMFSRRFKFCRLIIFGFQPEPGRGVRSRPFSRISMYRYIVLLGLFSSKKCFPIAFLPPFQCDSQYLYARSIRLIGFIFV